tara:strand:- start:9 stop:206 length:198 start_codon:yes stop_codon:yes gene_type:complete
MEISGLTPYQIQIVRKAMHTWIQAHPYVDEDPSHQELVDFVDLQVAEQIEGGAWKRRIREKGFVI